MCAKKFANTRRLTQLNLRCCSATKYMLLLSNIVYSYCHFFAPSPKQQHQPCLAERSKAAIALENCVMAAIHSQVFDNIAHIHKAEDTALHAFLEQLMAGQYDLYGTSPNLHVQVSVANG